MTTTPNTTEQTTARELTITRVFDAPRELVWKAWTEPEHLMRWWGPKNYTSPTAKMDLRVDGKYVFCMKSPEGQNMYSTGVFKEIVPMERITFTDSFSDAEGNVVSADQYGMGADIPDEFTVVVTFEDHEGKTKMTLKHFGLPIGEMADMTEAGWYESFDKLAASL